MLARMDIREKMRRDWDRRARVDPRYWVAATEEADEASYLESGARDAQALLDGLEGRVGADARVLDLGCGIGRMTARLVGHFAEVIGVDVSPAMIDEARTLHPETEGLRFQANSGADLSDFGDAAFDLVFSYSVLPHLPPDVVRAYFYEVNRVLKPGGWFRYQFWVGPEARGHADNDTLNIRVYDHDAFSALNREAGFRVEAVTDIDYTDPVLNLKPVWVNVQKVAEASAGGGALERPADEDSSEGERDLEYGLLLYLAVKHCERGEADEGERVLEQAVQTDRTRPEAYVQWAALRLERGDAAGALVIFEALTEVLPDEPIAWLYRAKTAEAADRPEEARRALARFDGLGVTDPALLAEADDVRGALPAAPASRRRKTVRVRKKPRKP
ncbi:MAG: methyltransferase domain-containing protein [Myxococcales bacterium]|nr:methyltransferase domain-containing protein [Myxococcales bacterium]